MGRRRDPLFIEASPYGNPMWRGAYPEYTFPNSCADEAARRSTDRVFRRPISRCRRRASTPAAIRPARLAAQALDRSGTPLERSRRSQTVRRPPPVGDLAAGRPRRPPGLRRHREPTRRTQERYGRNSFGWSLLMARRLVEAGVNLVQVNLGNNETWDTHGEAFPHLQEQAVPADRPGRLAPCSTTCTSSGLLDSTLIVMAGEFGRTPKVSRLPQHLQAARPRPLGGGADGLLRRRRQSRAARCVGSSDKIGGYPAAEPADAGKHGRRRSTTRWASPTPRSWHDDLDRPHHIYHGEPIAGLM